MWIEHQNDGIYNDVLDDEMEIAPNNKNASSLIAFRTYRIKLDYAIPLKARKPFKDYCNLLQLLYRFSLLI